MHNFSVVVVAFLITCRKGLRKKDNFCFRCFLLMVSVYNGNIGRWYTGYNNFPAGGVINFALDAGICFSDENNRF